jgi:GNAT superfamily N-acetyltransferase
VFVAESPDGQVVGWVQACVRAVLVADRHAEVEGLVVDASWRGKGIGRALMKRAEQWARQRGCKVVRLRSNVVREGARPFYEALGYKVVKTQWAFRKTLGKQAVDRRRPRHPA